MWQEHRIWQVAVRVHRSPKSSQIPPNFLLQVRLGPNSNCVIFFHIWIRLRGRTLDLKILGPPSEVKKNFVSKYGNIYIKRSVLKNVSRGGKSILKNLLT